MKKLFVILGISICSMFVSCYTPDPTVTKMYQLTEKDSGKILEVNIGEEINITLDDQSATEDWYLIGIYDRKFIDMIMNQSYGGKQYISFKVIGIGDTKVTLKYRHEIELDILKEYPTFTLTIKSKEN